MKRDHRTTRDAILTAAERLFALRGFEASSLRAITSAAKANLGAVNYHFATKDALILAVLSRRLAPLNQRGLALLDDFERKAAGKSVSVENVLDAMFRPALELITDVSRGGPDFLRLLAAALSEPGDYLRPLVNEHFAGRWHRFHRALRRAVPTLSAVEAHWRLHFAYGAFVHTVSHPHILELSSHGLCRVSDINKTLRRIVAFCAAGMKT